MISSNANATLHCPLTPQELALAKAHRIASRINDKFKIMMTSECEVERTEAREAHQEALTHMRENRHLFTSDYWFEASGIEKLTETSEEMRARLNNNFGMQSYNMPKQSFSFDAISNALTIGRGTRIPMGHYHLLVLDFMVGAFTNDWRNPNDGFTHLGNTTSAYTRSLDWLLRAAESGNAKLSFDKDLNQDTLSLLRRMGVDTSRDFSLNGTAFEVVNGFIQTKGFTHQQPERSILGIEGLNRLVERAYTENLFGS